MSLINDALKRASQAQPPPPPKETESPLRPVVTQSPQVWPYVAVSVLVVGIVSVGIWFFAQAYQTAKQTALNQISVPVAAREEPAPQPVDTAPQAVAIPAETNAVTASNEVAVTAPPKPTYKLQGIFYRPNRPVAMVNGKSLTIGEKVAGARVLAITSQSVTLDVQGEKTVLTLVEQ